MTDVYADADRVLAAYDPCIGDAETSVERGLHQLNARRPVLAVVPLTGEAFFSKIVPRAVVAVATRIKLYAANSLEQTVRQRDAAVDS